MLRRRAAAMVGAAALLAGCGPLGRELQRQTDSTSRAGDSGRAGRLTAAEFQYARTAWRYFENNIEAETGLANGMDRSPVFTTWHAGDLLAALVAAHELGVIGPREFDQRISRVLGFLEGMSLSAGALPNKAYHAGSGKSVDFSGRPADIGWSAVDCGRLLGWLDILGQRHAKFQEYADSIALRLRYCDVIDDCGVLYGANMRAGRPERYQEGRLGPEQLAAAGFAAWGFETRRSRQPATDRVRVDGREMHIDARDPRSSGAVAPLLTWPVALLGMEQGWRGPGSERMRAIAEAMYQAQEARWRRENILTARSDYQVREAPYIVLDSVHANGYAWNTIASDGTEFPRLALVSVRAAFSMWALWPGEYTDRLMGAVQFLHDPDRGWFEGRLESSGAPVGNITLSTNAAVLEALLFKAKGVLKPATHRPGKFAAVAGNPFGRPANCLPGQRAACKPEA
jgi:hypothetical protein